MYKLIQGDCIEVLKTLPAGSVQTCVTSPPYYGLRCYNGGDAEIGLESTPEEYVSKLVAVFREVRRVLHPTGTCWLNLGSSYASGDKLANRSHPLPHVPAYGNGGTKSQDSQGVDRAYHGSCDAPTDETQNHRDRNAHNDQSDGQGERLPLPTDHDNGRLGFETVTQFSFAPDAQESTTLESSFQLPGASSPEAKALVDPSKFGSYGHGVRESAHKAVNTPDKSLPSQTSDDRNSDKEPLDLALSSPKDSAALTYLYSTIASLDLQTKQLIPIPWLVALALQADGWWLRQDIIWHKLNPMPESVTDRCTKAHEYIFLLSKAASYYYDAEAIKEGGSGKSAGNRNYKYTGDDPYFRTKQGITTVANVEWHTRNRHSVWVCSTKPYSGAHFATFPPDLIEPCILAGSSSYGACAKCGAPWERIVEVTGRTATTRAERNAIYGDNTTNPDPRDTVKSYSSALEGSRNRQSKTLGWQPTCTCNADVVPCMVLDPFSGSGTTGAVALKHNRRYIGIELNPDYIELAHTRINETQPMLLGAL